MEHRQHEDGELREPDRLVGNALIGIDDDDEEMNAMRAPGRSLRAISVRNSAKPAIRKAVKIRPW